MPRDLRIWPEADAKLRKRWAAGVPCAQIGRELGVSAAAVIGRAKRLGLGRHPQARREALDKLAAETEAMGGYEW